MTAQPGTQIVSAYPYDLGEVMAGSFRALRRRPGLYFGLVIVGVLAVALPVLLAGAAMVVSLRGALDDGAPQAPPRAFFPALGLFFLLAILSGLVQLKVTGMLSLATKQLADGREPTVGGLWSGTKGLLPRLALLLALLYVVIGALTALAVGLVGALAYGASGGSDGGALAALAVLVLVSVFVLAPLALFLAVRWLYVLPVLAIERLTAIGALRRSWRLTSGRFWRTLGYLLLAVLLLMVVQTAISLPGQALSATPPISEEDLMAEYFSSLMTGLAVSTLLGFVASIVTTPFMAAYQTLMYVDAQRRADGAAAAYGPYGQPPQPGPYSYGQRPPPGQYPYT
jgi:Membrane domain of glycerophosphoryl diester phosphodiesterase